MNGPKWAEMNQWSSFDLLEGNFLLDHTSNGNLQSMLLKLLVKSVNIDFELSRFSFKFFNPLDLSFSLIECGSIYIFNNGLKSWLYHWRAETSCWRVFNVDCAC